MGEAENNILSKFGITDYYTLINDIDKPDMSPTKIRNLIMNNLEKAQFARRQINGAKGQIALLCNRKKISHEEKEQREEPLCDILEVLQMYIDYCKKRLETVGGSTKKKKGLGVSLLDNPDKLIAKLESIIDDREKIKEAGALIDVLLKLAIINPIQRRKLLERIHG